MRLYRVDTASTSRAARVRAQPASRPSSGVEGNARLTSAIGLVLLVLLFVEGMTVLSVRGMLTVHVFVGLLLIPPILLKMASTGYRFARYYLGSAEYRATGPPQILLRVIAPVMVACTVGLFGTGVALLIAGRPGGEGWRQLHTLCFFFWFWLMAIHVLGHTQRAIRLGLADLRGRVFGNRFLWGAITLQSFVLGSIGLGIAVAVVFLPLDASWLHWASRFGGDH